MLEALNQVISALEVIGKDLNDFSTYDKTIDRKFAEQCYNILSTLDIRKLKDQFTMFRAYYLSKAINYDALLENWKKTVEEESN